MSLLTLKHIAMPYIATRESEIWNQDIVFKSANYYHIKAASGQGKSSLMKCLYGLSKEYSGEIWMDDSNAKKISDDRWSDIRTSYLSIVFQDLKLLESESAYVNIELKRVLTNYHPEEKIKEFATRLEIDSVLDRKISTLSYGERQRVAIIRALMQPFQILLLDEPFSHLDHKNIQLASSLILEEVQQRNASILLTDLEDDQHFPYHQKFIL